MPLSLGAVTKVSLPPQHTDRHRHTEIHTDSLSLSHTHTHTQIHADTHRMVLCYKGPLPFCSEALWGRQATRKRGIGLTPAHPLTG